MLNRAHKMFYHTPLTEVFDSKFTTLVLINAKGRIFNNHYIDTINLLLNHLIHCSPCNMQCCIFLKTNWN